MSRRIPRTLATQHPDNAMAPYWRNNPFISTSKEVEECYRSFSDLDCQEYMWDWEGKFVDEAVVDRLFQRYLEYFQDHPLGRDRFLTLRIPNIQKEGPARLARVFAGILSGSYSATTLKLKSPPLFEVIHPMTASASQLKNIQKKFHETALFQKKILGVPKLKPQYLEIIPLIEGTGTLLKSRKILEEYTAFVEKFTEKPLRMIRPFIARSDPALDGGFVAAVLSAKAALSEYFRFENETKIKVHPIMGVGSLRFRGGLAPDTISEFLNTYPGIATVTVQSSFRYDHPLPKVKKAIRQLNEQLPSQEKVIFPAATMTLLKELDHIFVKHYRRTIEGLGPFINQLAPSIPSRRERLQHTGHFGYSRQLGKKGLQIPRAITFTAVFYSIGIPPELIGTGRGIREVYRLGKIKKLETIYPQLSKALIQVGNYLNRENLEILTRKNHHWKKVLEGITFLEEYLGTKLEPRGPEELIHRNYTSNVVQRWLRKEEVNEDILKAAEMRRSLG